MDQAHDAAQYWYLKLAAPLESTLPAITENNRSKAEIAELRQSPGIIDRNLPELISANQRDIAAADPAFRSFLAGGYEHMVLPRDAFYTYKSDGIRFTDWLADVLAGKPVASVACTTCDRPEFRYSSDDLAMVDRTLALLSGEDNWNPNHQGPCPQQGDQLSLFCAMMNAIKNISTKTPGKYAAVWDINYTTAERLGIPPPYSSIQGYNNHASTDWDDIRQLLTEVRERIVADLDRQDVFSR